MPEASGDLLCRRIVRAGRLATLVVVAGGIAAVCARPAFASPRSDFDVELTSAGISIRAERAELDRVVAAVASRVGMQVIVTRPLTGVVSIDVQDLSVAEALGRLLKRRSYLIAYSKPWAGALVDSPNRLWVLSGDDTGGANHADNNADGDFIALRAIALGAGDALAREEALQALAVVGGIAAEAVLREGLRDEDAGVREAAGELLALDPWEIP